MTKMLCLLSLLIFPTFLLADTEGLGDISLPDARYLIIHGKGLQPTTDWTFIQADHGWTVIEMSVSFAKLSDKRFTVTAKGRDHHPYIMNYLKYYEQMEISLTVEFEQRIGSAYYYRILQDRYHRHEMDWGSEDARIVSMRFDPGASMMEYSYLRQESGRPTGLAYREYDFHSANTPSLFTTPPIATATTPDDNAVPVQPAVAPIEVKPVTPAVTKPPAPRPSFQSSPPQPGIPTGSAEPPEMKDDSILD